MNNLTSSAHELSALMYGLNYAPSIHVIVVDGQDLAACVQSLAAEFPECSIPEESFSPVSNQDWLENVKFCFDYRGDRSAGLHLTAEAETNLKSRQRQFLDELQSQVAGSQVWETKSVEGLPIDSVFWHFCFLFVHPAQQSLVFFAGASD